MARYRAGGACRESQTERGGVRRVRLSVRGRNRSGPRARHRPALRPGGTIEIALADTIGVGVPTQVADLFGRLRRELPQMPLRAHFHNTRNTGIANAYAAIEAGVTALDGSVGGVGGCPFAPAATGNIPSEDLLYMLDRMGGETGVSLEAMIDTGRWLQEKIGRPIPGMLMKAGGFPRRTQRPT